MKGLFNWMLVGLLFLAGEAGARANYTGYSGAPGRQTCANSCHGNSNGTVSVTGFPELYTPGTPYTITLTRNSGNNIRNFNGSCRLGTGTSNAGVISSGTGTSTYNVNGETNGIHCGSGNLATCSFTWTAPAAGSGQVRLYIGAYQGSSENGQTSELTLTSEEGSAGEPELAITEVSVLSDDDNDGLAENGESVGLGLTLYNSGGGRVRNVSGLLSTESPWVQLTVTESDWPDIPAGQSGVNETAFLLFVDPSLTQDVVIPLNLQISSDEGDFVLEGELTVHWTQPPPLDLAARDLVVLSDDDQDGALEPGETCTFQVSLENLSAQSANGLLAVLAGPGPWLTVLDSLSAFPDLPPQGSGTCLVPFRVHLSAEAPALYEEALVLQVQSDQSAGFALLTLPVGRRVEVWSTDLEDGAPGWSHSAAEGWNDDWRLVEAGSGSPVTAWKCGAAGEGNYQNHQDARLVTPAVTLVPVSRLEFQHSISAETSSAYPDSAYDGGIVEISLDDGLNWEQIHPSDNYSHAFRHLTGAGNPTTHPFPGGTPCYSGVRAWESAYFDLSSFAGQTVRFRFRFGSDNGTGLTGWVVDDPRVVGLFQDTGVEGPRQRPGSLVLLPATPNPFNPSTQLSWEMSQSGALRLELYNLRGERVAVLGSGFYAAGRHELRLEAEGLASGAYLLKAEALGETRTQKILLLK